MQDIIIIAVAVVIALVVASVVTHFVTVSKLTKDADSKIGSAESRAREIIDDALKTAEAAKKEALLEVKEDSKKHWERQDYSLKKRILKYKQFVY